MDSACDRICRLSNLQVVNRDACETATLAEATKCIITGTGFIGEQRQLLKDLVREMGARYSGALINGHTTHLVCHPGDSITSEKFHKAKLWGIPVLPLSWLVGWVHAGVLLPFEASSSHPPALDISCALPSGPSWISAQHSDRAAARVPSNLTLPMSSSPPPQSACVSESALSPSAAPEATYTLNSSNRAQGRCTSLSAAAGNSAVPHPTTSADANLDHSSQHGSGHIRAPPVAVTAEPEKRRAAVLQPAAFGMDILQDVHSPGDRDTGPGMHSKLRQVTCSSSVLWEAACPVNDTFRAPSSASMYGAHTGLQTVRSASIGSGTPPANQEAASLAARDSAQVAPWALSLEPSAQQQQRRRRHGVRFKSPSVQSSPGSCQPSQPCKVPRTSSARQFHGLQSTAGVKYFKRLQIMQDSEPGTACYDFKVPDSEHGALLYTADGPLGAHVLSFAEILAVYELRGVAWIEHLYLYDEEDIQIDSRRQGATFLRQHCMQPGELVACPIVHHSRAAAIEGHFRVYQSQGEAASATAAAAAVSEEEPAMFSTCSWNPDTGGLLPPMQVGGEGRTRADVRSEHPEGH